MYGSTNPPSFYFCPHQRPDGSWHSSSSQPASRSLGGWEQASPSLDSASPAPSFHSLFPLQGSHPGECSTSWLFWLLHYTCSKCIHSASCLCHFEIILLPALKGDYTRKLSGSWLPVGMITATLGNPFKVSLELGEIHKEMGQHVVSSQGSQHSLGAAIT